MNPELIAQLLVSTVQHSAIEYQKSIDILPFCPAVDTPMTNSWSQISSGVIQPESITKSFLDVVAAVAATAVAIAI